MSLTIPTADEVQRMSWSARQRFADRMRAESKREQQRMRSTAFVVQAQAALILSELPVEHEVAVTLRRELLETEYRGAA